MSEDLAGALPIKTLTAAFGKGNSSDGHVPVRVPFRLLVIADLGGRGDGLPQLVGDDGLPGLMRRFNTSIVVEAANFLGDAPRTLALTCAPRRLRDFLPETILSASNELSLAHEFLKSSAGQRRDSRYDALNKLLSSGRPTALPPDDLDGLLSLVALPDAVENDETLSSAGHADPADVLAAQSRAFLANRRLVAIESNWRALDLILTNAAGAVEVAIADCGMGDPESVLERIFEDAAPHLSLVLLLGHFSANDRDIARLAVIARIAHGVGVPVSATLSPDFLGGRNPADVVAMDRPSALLEGPEYTALSGLAGRPEAASLILCWNDVVATPKHSLRDPLFVDAAAGLAALVCSSLAKTDLPLARLGQGTRIVAPEVLETQLAGGRRVALPLRAPVNSATALDLASAGVTTLCAGADRDHVFLVSAPTLAGKHGPPLPHSLCGAHIMQHLLAALDGANLPADVEARSAVIEQIASAVVGAFGGSAHVLDVRLDAQGRALAELEIAFGADILDGQRLSFEIG